MEGTLDETPVAQRALAEDRVIAVSEDLEHELPARYARFAGITTLTCTPVSAGGRLARRDLRRPGRRGFELGDEEQQTMATLGRLAALAASVERATRQDERARQLNERIELTREIHERVIQRLFGVSLALGSEDALSAEERATCHDELQATLADLRIGAWAADRAAGRPRQATLAELVARRAERRPELSVDWEEGVEVPARLEPHRPVGVPGGAAQLPRSTPTRARSTSASLRRDGAFELEVANDGARPRPTAAGARAGPGSAFAWRRSRRSSTTRSSSSGRWPAGRWHVRLVASAASR